MWVIYPTHYPSEVLRFPDIYPMTFDYKPNTIDVGYIPNPLPIWSVKVSRYLPNDFWL